MHGCCLLHMCQHIAPTAECKGHSCGTFPGNIHQITSNLCKQDPCFCTAREASRPPGSRVLHAQSKRIQVQPLGKASFCPINVSPKDCLVGCAVAGAPVLGFQPYFHFSAAASAPPGSYNGGTLLAVLLRPLPTHKQSVHQCSDSAIQSVSRMLLRRVCLALHTIMAVAQTLSGKR